MEEIVVDTERGEVNPQLALLHKCPRPIVTLSLPFFGGCLVTKPKLDY